MDHPPVIDRPVAPVAAGRRIESLDAVRGFALLGILVPNLMAFAWPSGAMWSPEQIIGDDAGTRAGVWITEIFFVGKMMFLFATLFGAGVVLYGRKFDPPPGQRARLSRGAGLWYARCGWLLLLGLAHAFGLWFGDILVWYAVAGMTVLWWCRRLSPRTLLAIGAVLYLLGTALSALWMQMGVHFSGPESMLGKPDAEAAAYLGSYADGLTLRALTVVGMYLLYLPVALFALVGLMLGGMGLVKSGWLEGARPARHYAVFALVALPLSLGLSIAVRTLIYREVQTLPAMAWFSVAQLCGIPTSLGYAAALIWCVKAGVLRPVLAALEAVGRMALSNYFLQTILCTTLFYGYGFGLFAKVGYPALFGVAAAVWAVNIAFSLLWLRVFRFGPAEWLWRTLTYLRPQPMRRPAAVH
jgi:uncharacterized protein